MDSLATHHQLIKGDLRNDKVLGESFKNFSLNKNNDNMCINEKCNTCTNITKFSDDSNSSSIDKRNYEQKIKYENENENWIGKLKVEEKKKAGDETEDEVENKPDYEIYNFRDSGIGQSWTLGNESDVNANAYINGLSACPENIIVPRTLTCREGLTRLVEVIGQYAYNACGNAFYESKTKSVLVTKQVKIINYNGFGAMPDLESFRIEEGSVLETIYQFGLASIGHSTVKFHEEKRGTLVLPSTLSSVSNSGIFFCNLFNTIIYCGTHYLYNSSSLEDTTNFIKEKTKVLVTNQYPESTIFNRVAYKDYPNEVEGNCSKMEVRPTPSIKRNDFDCSVASRGISPVVLSSSLLSVGDIFSLVEGEGKGKGKRHRSFGTETKVFVVIENRKRNQNKLIKQSSFHSFWES